MVSPGLLFAEKIGDKLAITATGDWCINNAATLETELMRHCGDAKLGHVMVDMSKVGEFDSYGAWLLERFRRHLEAAGSSVVIRSMPASDKALFAEMASVNRAQLPQGSQPPPDRRVADRDDGLAHDLGGFATLTGAVFTALGRVIVRPRAFRMTSTVHQFDRVAWQAVPIIMMITFLIGAILAQQGFFHFRKFGADLYVVDMIGFLIMRELGVLLVAIMVAGRTGSSYTAELGSMKMREEIDALRTMGFDPVEILILPRILILVIAMPVLTFIGNMAALYGAGVVATLYGGLSVDLFVDRLREAITMDHFLVGLIKAPFIGFVIGIIACNEGLSAKGSAASLGHQTTKSVVKAIFMVIVLDGLFALFFSSIRM
jgi:phospholipid/cholesterol/gamma-HCH transport system permease protein